MASIKDKIKKNFENRNSFGDIRVFSKPDGVEFYKPKEGINRIRILNYPIKSSNHPDNKLNRDGYAIGESDYKLQYWVHRGIGIAKGSYICLAKTYQKPCPICEELERLKQDIETDEEIIKDLKASERVLYNVYDERDEKIKLFEVSKYLFEKELVEEACIGEEITDFTDNKIVKFRAVTKTLGKNEYFEYKSFDFIDAEEGLTKDIHNSIISLDTILNVPTYDEVKNAFLAIDVDEEKEEPSKKQEDSKPIAERKSEKRVGSDCPHGHVFGKDCEEFEDCDTCKSWEKCSEAV